MENEGQKSIQTSYGVRIGIANALGFIFIL